MEWNGEGKTWTEKMMARVQTVRQDNTGVTFVTQPGILETLLDIV